MPRISAGVKDIIIHVVVPNSLGIAVIIIWVLMLNSSVLDPFYDSMSPAKIDDFSLGIIQGIGILVSFITASGFFYLGKLGELFANTMKSIRKFIIQIEDCKGELSRELAYVEEIKRTFKTICSKNKINPEEILLDGQSADNFLGSLGKDIEEIRKKIQELSKEISELPKEFTKNERSAEMSLMTTFLLALGFLFSSIFMAIISFITNNPKTIAMSVDFILIGVVFTFTSWYAFYWTIGESRTYQESIDEQVLRAEVLFSSLGAIKRTAQRTKAELIMLTSQK